MTEQLTDSNRNTPRVEFFVWRVIWDAVRESPWWGKTAIVGFGTAFVVATLLGAAGFAGSDHPNASLHVASIVLANVGLLLLCVTALLHTGTQQAWHRPEIWRTFARLPFHTRARRVHVVMLALPLIAFKAGILLAAGTALLIPSMFGPTADGFFAIAGAFYGLFILVAGWTVRDTVRFLYHHAEEQGDAAAEARHEATAAQLSALQAQLNPHFLFNALNTVASLVRSNPRTAESTVENLAQVLRRTLDRSRRMLCTVKEEVDYLNAYLAVERARFGDRLQVTMDIDPRAMDVQIPPMTLQPLVENALKHAIGAKIEGGAVRVVVGFAVNSLELSVEDDGLGFSAGYVEGTGLSNLRERLITMYGEEATLSVRNLENGARVLLVLPVPQSHNGAKAQDNGG